MTKAKPRPIPLSLLLPSRTAHSDSRRRRYLDDPPHLALRAVKGKDVVKVKVLRGEVRVVEGGLGGGDEVVFGGSERGVVVGGRGGVGDELDGGFSAREGWL
jgi:hypothetical protein